MHAFASSHACIHKAQILLSLQRIKNQVLCLSLSWLNTSYHSLLFAPWTKMSCFINNSIFSESSHVLKPICLHFKCSSSPILQSFFLFFVISTSFRLKLRLCIFSEPDKTQLFPRYISLKKQTKNNSCFLSLKCHAQMLTRPEAVDFTALQGAVLLGVEVWVWHHMKKKQKTLQKHLL